MSAAHDGSLASVLSCDPPPSSGQDGVPTLHHLCCEFIMSTIINLDNAPSIVCFARAHGVEKLANRGEAFCRNSWRGLIAKHEASELREMIGDQMYEALDNEHTQLDQRLSRLRMKGTVLDNPPPACAAPSAVADASDALTAADFGRLVGCSLDAFAALRPWRQNEKLRALPPEQAEALRRLIPPPAAPATAPAQAPSSSSASGGGGAGSTSTTPRKAPSQRFAHLGGGGGEKCAICSKTVYMAERMGGIKDLVYHTDCFRCTVRAGAAVTAGAAANLRARVTAQQHIVYRHAARARGPHLSRFLICVP